MLNDHCHGVSTHLQSINIIIIIIITIMPIQYVMVCVSLTQLKRLQDFMILTRSTDRSEKLPWNTAFSFRPPLLITRILWTTVRVQHLITPQFCHTARLRILDNSQ